MGLTKRVDGLWIVGLAAVACACLALLVAGAPTALAGSGYDYYIDGSAADVSAATTAGLLLAGGATDNDDAMRWFLDRSGGGDIVVLDAYGRDDYGPYIYDDLGGVDSVQSFVFKQRSASWDPFVLETLAHAEAIFIDGGNQWNYVSLWQDTPVEDAINAAALTKPVGGISAGLAVQGEFCYGARLGTIRSGQALKDPYYSHVWLVKDFLRLPFLGGTITDSHFVARDRMGRLMTFLARIVNDGWAAQARGIGVDESTTVAVDERGRAQVFGVGTAYFLQTNGAPEVCVKGQPLTFTDVSVYKVMPGATFDLAAWAGRGGTAYSLSAIEGVLHSTQDGGAIY
jgi:cyanophycinase-like exopeptidase